MKDVVEGSIVDLSALCRQHLRWRDLPGRAAVALYNRNKRDRAYRELVRVAKPGAPIAVSVMSRFSVLVVELTLFPEEVECRIIQDAYHRASSLRPRCISFRIALFAQGTESASLKNAGKAWKIWRATHLKTCTHPAVVGTSEHMLIVARKH